MKDEALRLSLEALENLQSLRQYHKAIAAIKQALEHPEEEPVACNECKEWEKVCDQHLRHIKKLKAKREWQGLSDDEIDLLEELYAPPVHPDFVNDADHCTELIRHVQAKLKEKNT